MQIEYGDNLEGWFDKSVTVLLDPMLRQVEASLKKKPPMFHRVVLTDAYKASYEDDGSLCHMVKFSLLHKDPSMQVEPIIVTVDFSPLEEETEVMTLIIDSLMEADGM